MRELSFFRKLKNVLFMGFCWLSLFCALVPLLLIFAYVFLRGFESLSWDFFLHLPKPVGELGGGMANALLGSLMMLLLALGVGLPIGIFSGIFLAEWPEQKLVGLVRSAAELLNGTPSIVVGIFIYSIVVMNMGSFSAYAGSLALAIIMIPLVLRTTEEMLRLVPRNLREGALAPGIPYWKVIIFVVVSTARSGILTGCLLAIARISGETAPLLFTALGNQFWNTKLAEPMAALPLQIFTYAISPFEDWQRMSWAGSLVLILAVLTLNVSARLFSRARTRGAR